MMKFYPTSFYYLNKATPTEQGWTQVHGYVSTNGSTAYYLYYSADFGRNIIVTDTWCPYKLTIDNTEAPFKGFFNGKPFWSTGSVSLYFDVDLNRFVISASSSANSVNKVFQYSGSYTDYMGRTVNYNVGEQYWFNTSFNYGVTGTFSFSQNGGGTAKSVKVELYRVSQCATLLGHYATTSGGVTPTLSTRTSETVYQGTVGAMI